MTKDGELSKRELDRLKSSIETMDNWIEWQEKNNLTVEDDVYYIACSAVYRLREFIEGYKH